MAVACTLYLATPPKVNVSLNLSSKGCLACKIESVNDLGTLFTKYINIMICTPNEIIRPTLQTPLQSPSTWPGPSPPLEG